MNKIQATLASAMMLAAATTAQAGGILTNTNQSIDFLRNPARDASIALDGVYSNPAGVAFMPEGLHIGFNWQYARQTRTITSTNDFFKYGRKNNGQATKSFEGTADAPFIPSLQAAYNTGDWSWQLNLSVPGGGGSCEFADGLGSFESVVGNIATQLTPFGAQGYDMDGYMEGRQYYFGIQAGTAYKVNDHLSVYGGLRVLYGTATYKAKISNIMVNVGEDRYMNFGSFLQTAATTVDNNIDLVNAGMAQYEAAGATAVPQYAELVATKARLEGAKKSFSSLQKYSQGVNLLCNQSGVGVAPVIGVDYRLNHQ